MACQSVPEQPRLQVAEPPKVITVEKVVAKPCLTVADLPAAPALVTIDTGKASTAQLAAAASINAREREAYLRRLEAVLLQCTK